MPGPPARPRVQRQCRLESPARQVERRDVSRPRAHPSGSSIRLRLHQVGNRTRQRRWTLLPPADRVRRRRMTRPLREPQRRRCESPLPPPQLGHHPPSLPSPSLPSPLAQPLFTSSPFGGLFNASSRNGGETNCVSIDLRVLCLYVGNTSVHLRPLRFWQICVWHYSPLRGRTSRNLR